MRTTNRFRFFRASGAIRSDELFTILPLAGSRAGAPDMAGPGPVDGRGDQASATELAAVRKPLVKKQPLLNS